MPKAGHMYKINEEIVRIPNIRRIYEILRRWENSVVLEEYDVTLRRNFSELVIVENQLNGNYQIDVPIYIQNRDGSTRVYPSLVESEFVIKDNGRIIFFGKKKFGNTFLSDISSGLEDLFGNQIFNDICIMQTVSLEIMNAVVNAPQVQSITYSAFEGDFDNFTNKQSIGGENLQQSTIFTDLRRRGNLYRLILRMLTPHGPIVVQITENGLILGYGEPIIEDLLEIVEFLERHGL